MTRPVELIDLRGDPFEIGCQHGAACRDAIAGFLANRCARLLADPGDGPSRARLMARADEYRAVVERSLPHVAAEIDGLAEGAGISRAEAALLQFRRELLPGPAQMAGECTLLGMRDYGGEPLIAQNIDLNGGMTDLGIVLRETPDDPELPRVLMYSFAGLLGFVGMNDAGLAIGLNLVVAGHWGLGVSPYLLVKHLLRFRTVGQCQNELGRIGRASSRALTICDAESLVAVELTVTDSRCLGGDMLCHTNHYLHPDLEARDEMNIFTRNASRRRYEIALDHVGRLDREAGPEALFEIFADHSLYPLGLCVHGEGNPDRDETVACVVMRPKSGELLVRRGNPCEAETQSFFL